MYHTVIYNQGDQSVVSVPFNDGRPVVVGTATYSIVDLRKGDQSPDRTIVASTGASVDGYDGTTQALAGAGASDSTLLELDDVTGLAVGSRYLLTGGGNQALVEIRALDAGNDYAYLKAPLTDRFAVGSTLSGIQVTGTFPTAEAADEQALESGGGPYAVDWVFDGVPGPVRELIWMRRHARTPMITVDDVDTLDPQILRTTGNLFAIDKLIEQAERDFNAELLAAGHQPERFHGTELARNAVTYRTAYLGRLHMGRDRDDELMSHYLGRWIALTQNLTIGKPGAGVAITTVDDDAEAGDTSSVTNLIALS